MTDASRILSGDATTAGRRQASSMPAGATASAAIAGRPRRWRQSSSISAVRVAPTRVTPRARTSSRASRVRMPPAAFTCTLGGEWRRISCEVGEGGSAGGVAGGGLDPVHADVAADFAQADLGGVVEVGVLEDHLDLRAGGVRGCGEDANFALDVVPVAAARLADVDDHVEFGGAVVERLLDFGELDRGGVAAVGKADGGAGLHRASGEQHGAARRVVGQDANAGDVVAQGQAGIRLRVRAR